MDKNAVLALLTILATVSGCCVFLVPKSSQDQLDEKMKSLSERVRKLSFWNFATIERDIAFSWLKAIFQARVNGAQFYINVAGYTAVFTEISLFPYLFVQFSDPLSVSMVGFPLFFLMGFFIPNMIVALISMAITVGLLTLGARIRNGGVYVFILILDVLIVSALIASLSINLEMTRDYLSELYGGDIAANRWLTFYQPFLAMWHVIAHPVSIMEAFRAEFYISVKYTTYIISVSAMFIAVVPLILHALAALFLVFMAVFHKYMKKIASFLLVRMNEQKTFKWLTWVFGLPVVCIKIWDSL